MTESPRPESEVLNAAIAHSLSDLQTQNAVLQAELAQCRQELAQLKAANCTSESLLDPSEEWLRLAIDLNQISLWTWELATGKTEWNENNYRLLGYEPGAVEPSYERWLDRLHPDDRERVQTTPAQAIKTRSIRQFDYRVIHPDGSIRWIVDRSHWRYDATGQPVQMVGVAIDITERKAMEEAHYDLNHELERHVQAQTQQLRASEANLRQQEQEFRTLAENAPDSIFRFDLEWRYLYLNPAAEKTLGYPRSLVLGKRDRDLNLPADVLDFWEQTLQSVVQTQRLLTVEFSIPAPNGRHWFQSHNIPEFDASGNLTSILVIERDITAFKQTEAALRHSESRFQRLLANLPGVIYQFRVTPDGTQTFPYISTYFEQLYETPIEAVLDDANVFLNGCHADDRASLEASIAVSYETLQPWIWEGRFVTPSGRNIWIQAASNPESQPNGDVLWDGIVIDISDRKRAEAERQQAVEALRYSEEQLRTIFDNAPIAISLVDVHSYHVVARNSAHRQLLGYDDEEFVKMTFVDFTHPDDVSTDIDQLQQLIAGNQSQFQMEKRFITKNGDIVLTDLIVTLICDRDGNPRYSLGMFQNITEAKRLDVARRQTEEALRRSQASLIEAQRIAHVGSWEIDLTTQKGAWSAEMFRLFGLAPDQPVPKTEQVMQFIHPDDRLMYDQVMERAFQQGEPHAVDHRLIRPDGSMAWIYSLGGVERDAAGQITRLFGVALDISDRKQAEADLRRSLQEKEVLLKEVHHRVKNNLQIISSLLRMQSRKVDNLQTFTVLQEAQNRVQSMALIHEQLYQSSDLTQIDLDEYLHSLVSNLFRSYGISQQQVTLSIETNGTCLNLNSAISCGLIINELVSNSLKYAFPAEQVGAITICLTSVLDESLNAREGSLQITDNGVGIPATVDWQNSPSLGMRIVRNLVHQIKGEIRRLPQTGTAFQITFAIANP